MRCLAARVPGGSARESGTPAIGANAPKAYLCDRERLRSLYTFFHLAIERSAIGAKPLSNRPSEASRRCCTSQFAKVGLGFFQQRLLRHKLQCRFNFGTRSGENQFRVAFAIANIGSFGATPAEKIFWDAIA